MSRRIGNQTRSDAGCIFRALIFLLLFFIALYFFVFIIVIALIIAAIFFAVKYLLHVFGIRKYEKIFNIWSNRATYRYDEFDGQLRRVEIIDSHQNESLLDRSYGAVPRFFKNLLNKITGRK